MVYVYPKSIYSRYTVHILSPQQIHCTTLAYRRSAFYGRKSLTVTTLADPSCL